jgi:hypothetical protein
MAVKRVYFKEYVTVYTSGSPGSQGLAECRAWFAEHYGGKIHDYDWTVLGTSIANPGKWQARLQLRLWNRRGEFVSAPDAEALAAEIGHGAVIVDRWSPEEDELLSYGKKKLSA